MSLKHIREYFFNESELILTPGHKIALKEWLNAVNGDNRFYRRMYGAWMRYFADLNFLNAVVGDSTKENMIKNLEAENTALDCAIEHIRGYLRDTTLPPLTRTVTQTTMITLELEKEGNQVIIDDLKS